MSTLTRYVLIKVEYPPTILLMNSPLVFAGSQRPSEPEAVLGYKWCVCWETKGVIVYLLGFERVGTAYICGPLTSVFCSSSPNRG